MEEIETATITLDRLKELQEAELILSALSEAGVDNWDGWGDAMKILKELQEGYEEE